jgi:hypothetical protein
MGHRVRVLDQTQNPKNYQTYFYKADNWYVKNTRSLIRLSLSPIQPVNYQNSTESIAVSNFLGFICFLCFHFSSYLFFSLSQTQIPKPKARPQFPKINYKNSILHVLLVLVISETELLEKNYKKKLIAMAQAVEEWYKQMPIITRSYLTAAIVTTIGCSLDVSLSI